ncbi:hypothetical protein LOK49_LG07G01765 [Camellia lanceoleosa]|uniref:Uncharacterized protein n=1 Tax=Camellia lanceoleosa TaxID=1840588 RepID=A0ACC0GZ04_9ERIC|nr:hypothetical protein LOK49_LG07G01765 [Camellia lanceoleosa]
MYSTHFGSHTSLLQHISVKKLTVCDRGRSLGPGGEVHKTSMSPPQSKFAVIILVMPLDEVKFYTCCRMSLVAQGVDT